MVLLSLMETSTVIYAIISFVINLDTSWDVLAPKVSMKPTLSKLVGKFVVPCHFSHSHWHSTHNWDQTPAPSSLLGKEREDWITCPIFWLFREAAWEIGFCLAHLRLPMESSRDGGLEAIENKAQWHAATPENVECKRQRLLQFSGL